MKAPERRKWPTLAAAWDEYGHEVPWEKLVDLKVGTSQLKVSYIAVAWDAGDGMVEYADLATPDGGRTWEMQNDSCGHVAVKAWKKAKQVPECDWLDIAMEEE